MGTELCQRLAVDCCHFRWLLSLTYGNLEVDEQELFCNPKVLPYGEFESYGLAHCI